MNQAKALVAGAIAGLAVLGAAIKAGEAPSIEVIETASAFLVAWQATYWTTNKP